jgi:hypothetical protein
LCTQALVRIWLCFDREYVRQLLRRAGCVLTPPMNAPMSMQIGAGLDDLPDLRDLEEVTCRVADRAMLDRFATQQGVPGDYHLARLRNDFETFVHH